VISRRIRSRLIELNAESPKYAAIFIGRRKYLDELELALSKPPVDGPSVAGMGTF
jgi:hypothetical protein